MTGIEFAALAERIARLERVLLPTDEPVGEISFDGGGETVRDVVRFVAFHTGILARDIVGPHRDQVVFRARAAVCWTSLKLLSKTSSVIGRELGYRDHTTILAATRRAEQMIETDPAFALLCRRLRLQFAPETVQ